MENFRSTVHVKQANMSKAEYCRSFGWAVKEAVKRVTTCATYYHTSRRSWFPKPEGGLLLSQVPVMKPLPIVNMSPADCNALRNWASSYGAAVRQRTVRQETTMARHGTRPEFMYQRQCEISDKPVSIQGLKGEVLGALEPGAQASFYLEPRQKWWFWPNRALEYSLGALEPQFFCLGALEPSIFYPGVWSPKPLWDPVHCLWRAGQYSRRCRCRTHCQIGRRRRGRI